MVGAHEKVMATCKYTCMNNSFETGSRVIIITQVDMNI